MAVTSRVAPIRLPPVERSRPATSERSRPDLRVVTPARSRIGAPVVVVVTIVVFVVLLGTAGLNTVIVARQRQLDRVEQQIRDASTRNEALTLEVAELESPGRIVEQARADGMDIPDEVTWLAPRADGGADSSIQERATAPDDADGGREGTDDGDEGDVGDERALGGADGSTSSDDGSTGSHE